jgi:hypothetical protein
MKNKITVVFLFVFSYCLVAHAVAGDSKNKQAEIDLAKVRTAYDRTANIAMDVEYKLYANHTTTDVLEVHKGFYCKQGVSNLYMELYGTLTIQNKEYIFVKDDSSKIVLLAKNKAVISKSPTPADFQKLLTVCNTVTAMPTVGNVKGYKLAFPTNELVEMNAIDIYFDTTNFFATKVVLFYNASLEINPENGVRKYIKPRLEVNYLNINTAPDFKKDQFIFDKYLKKNAKTWQIQNAYSEYELMDQTEVN